MVKYHPVHVTKNRIKTDDVTDIYFVERLLERRRKPHN